MAPSLNTLVFELQSQRKTGLYCDTLLKVSDKLFWAHSCVLAAASQFFHRFFGDCLPRQFSQASPQIIEIQVVSREPNDCYEEAVLLALDYVYVGDIDLVRAKNCAKELLEIAQVMELDSLVKLNCIVVRPNDRLYTSKLSNAYKETRRNTFVANDWGRLVSVAIQVNDTFIDSTMSDVEKSANPVSNIETDIERAIAVAGNKNDVNGACNSSTVARKADENEPSRGQYLQTCDELAADIMDKKDEQTQPALNDKALTNNSCSRLAYSKSASESQLGNTSDSSCTRITNSSLRPTRPQKLLVNALSERNKISVAAAANKYQCDSCCYSTNSVRFLSRHLKSHKTEQKVCFYCDKHFSTRDALSEHMSCHEGPNPFRCLQCGNQFKSRTHLDIHMAKHSVERPFICDMCSMAFKWKHALKNHQIIHSNQKQYLCDNCGYATAHRSQLKAHYLLHTGDLYKCKFPECTFESTKKQNIKYHELTHTHEKVHQCDVCGQSFSLLKNLRRHSLLHSSVRPHRCEQCTFSTTRLDKLREHQLHHHAVGMPHERRKRSILTDSASTVSNKSARRSKVAGGASARARGDIIHSANSTRSSKENENSILFEAVSEEDDPSCEGTESVNEAKSSGALESYSFEAEKAEDGEQAVYSLTTNCFPSLQVLPLAQTLFVSTDSLQPHSTSLTDFILSQPLDDGELHEVDPPGDLMSSCGRLFQADLNLGCSLELIETSIIND